MNRFLCVGTGAPPAQTERKLGNRPQHQNHCRTVPDQTDDSVRPYMDLADPISGTFSRPYTKKKNAASTRKNNVNPNIFASYFQTEVICLAGKTPTRSPAQ